VHEITAKLCKHKLGYCFTNAHTKM